MRKGRHTPRQPDSQKSKIELDVCLAVLMLKFKTAPYSSNTIPIPHLYIDVFLVTMANLNVRVRAKWILFEVYEA